MHRMCTHQQALPNMGKYYCSGCKKVLYFSVPVCMCTTLWAVVVVHSASPCRQACASLNAECVHT